jgi:hypothetical protein
MSVIDPHDFVAPEGLDPWAIAAAPSGALSLNLWKPDASPTPGW